MTKYCCRPLELTIFSSACLSLDCSLYCHKKKMTKGEPQRRPSQRCHSEAHGIATMYSLTDYAREGQYIFI